MLKKILLAVLLLDFCIADETSEFKQIVAKNEMCTYLFPILLNDLKPITYKDPLIECNNNDAMACFQLGFMANVCAYGVRAAILNRNKTATKLAFEDDTLGYDKLKFAFEDAMLGYEGLMEEDLTKRKAWLNELCEHDYKEACKALKELK